MITNSELHYVLIKEVVNNGVVPKNSYLADYFQTSELEVKKALYRLQEYHGVVLHPNEPKVWAVHPFSLAPTNFYVQSTKGEWWGNCAWCSLGIAALVNTDVTISTSIGAEGSLTKIHIKNGEILEHNLVVHFPIPMKRAWDNVMYTCSNMLVFENEKQVLDWSVRHHIPKGDIQPVQRVWEFSKKWYGNHLNPEWTKWSVQEARNLFKEFGLTHSIWDLTESEDRF